MSWIDAVPAGERAGVLGLVGVALGVPTLLLGALGLPDRAADAIAVGSVALALGALGLAWRRHGAPDARLRAERREEDRRSRDLERGVVVEAWTPRAADALDRLAARDKAFSAPLLLVAIRALAAREPAACAEVVDARLGEGRIAVEAVVRTAREVLRVTVHCDDHAPSPMPGEVPGPWRLDSVEPVPAPPPAPVRRDPAVAAARRALVARDALDPFALEALAREVSAAVGAGDDAVAPYTSSDGRADLAWWRATGLPAGGEDVDWLEVVQDGWFERIEVRLGQRVLSLRRATGRPDAPWELWRLRRWA